MKALSYYYLGLPEKPIPDKNDFYKSGIPEASKIRNIISTAGRIFVTNDGNIRLSLVGDSGIYKIELYSSGTIKFLQAILYYLPGEQRIDFYDGGDQRTPIFVWVSKNCVVKNINDLLASLKVENLLLPIVSYS